MSVLMLTAIMMLRGVSMGNISVATRRRKQGQGLWAAVLVQTGHLAQLRDE
jgi:hypothetical protein